MVWATIGHLMEPSTPPSPRLIERQLAQELRAAASEYAVVTLLGPRQSGKTTLARVCFPDKPWVSLEDPDVRLAAQTDPRGFLAQYPDGLILDEVQRAPELLSYLQGMVDRDARPGRFILTGSHQPRLQEAIAQSLAGRTAVLTLWPLSLAELRQTGGSLDAFERIVRGTYPRVERDRLDPARFYTGYVQTYLERDVRALLQVRDLTAFQRFVTLLAGRIGQLVNLTALANDVGVSVPTLRQWLSMLQATYLVFELPAWSLNVRKRVVKSSKLYFADTGLAAWLLGIETADQARRDPLRGALYENLLIADALRTLANRGVRAELFFYRDAAGHEVDLLIRRHGRLIPYEIKSAATFTRDFLKGLRHLKDELGDALAPGFVLYDGPVALSVEGVRVINPMMTPDFWPQRSGAGPATAAHADP